MSKPYEHVTITLTREEVRRILNWYWATESEFGTDKEDDELYAKLEPLEPNED